MLARSVTRFVHKAAHKGHPSASQMARTCTSFCTTLAPEHASRLSFGPASRSAFRSASRSAFQSAFLHASTSGQSTSGQSNFVGNHVPASNTDGAHKSTSASTLAATPSLVPASTPSLVFASTPSLVPALVPARAAPRASFRAAPKRASRRGRSAETIFMDAEMRELQKTQDALDAWIADQNAQEEVRKGNDALIQIAGWTGVVLIVMAYLK